MNAKVTGVVTAIEKDAKSITLIVDEGGAGKAALALRCWQDGVKESAGRLSEGDYVTATVTVTSKKNERGYWNTSCWANSIAREEL